jgi:hypothetical protein
MSTLIRGAVIAALSLAAFVVGTQRASSSTPQGHVCASLCTAYYPDITECEMCCLNCCPSGNNNCQTVCVFACHPAP